MVCATVWDTKKMAEIGEKSPSKRKSRQNPAFKAAGEHTMPKPTYRRSLIALSCAALLLACGGGFGSPKSAPQSPGHSGGYATRTSHAQPAGDDSGSRAPAAESVSSTHGGASDYRASEPAPRAPNSVDSIATNRNERPGLGTRFGERRSSEVVQKRFVRGAKRPFAQVAIHYNNLAGIQQQAAFRGTSLHELRARTQGGGLSISVLDEYGRLLQGGNGGGRTYVVGRDGQRYTLQIRNDTGGRYEVVSSVDGLDVVDGKPANYSKRGYIVAPYSTLEIEGFRTSLESVAAFRFGSVGESYAARTSGDRNVGVIGFAFFAERGSEWRTDEVRRRETANPFPGGFAAPPAVIR